MRKVKRLLEGWLKPQPDANLQINPLITELDTPLEHHEQVHTTTLFPRSSGVLLHPTSLPGPYGIGDLGPMAFRFVDWLASCQQTLWQTLPVGPTGYGDSPYQSLSAFAGNPMLISIELLMHEGLLTNSEIEGGDFPEYHVDYGRVIGYKQRLLKRAFERFAQDSQFASARESFQSWCSAETPWLDSWSLFATLKQLNQFKPWYLWQQEYVDQQTTAINRLRLEHASMIEEHKFLQWLFFKQWQQLKEYSNSKQVRLVGDIPIFVAHDSCDVWVDRRSFTLDPMGRPTEMAGVPPDYFSADGQLWGNPLYHWDVMKRDRYTFWSNRIAMSLRLFDIIRIDHFRGFQAYWSVPGGAKTAINGRWKPGPGDDFFQAMSERFGQLPIIAEDLGLITPDVFELRDRFQLPGMKVLQFAFGGCDPENIYLPHHYQLNSVVYTGTHDNNTSLGWWFSNEIGQESREFVSTYLGHQVTEINWDLIRLAHSSVAHSSIVPLQDVWGFGADTRMNRPGSDQGNWCWRFSANWFDHPGKDRLAYLTQFYSRVPKVPADDEDHVA